MEKLQTILQRIIGSGPGDKGLGNVDISAQFAPDSSRNIGASLNAAFFIALCGPSHPLCTGALAFLETYSRHPDWGHTALFYLDGIKRIREEIGSLLSADSEFRDNLDVAHQWCGKKTDNTIDSDARRNLWNLFFPEGVRCDNRRPEKVEQLREKRKIQVTRACPDPLCSVPNELLLTSNILLTLPSDPAMVKSLPFTPDFLEKLEEAIAEPQSYWYDHPIHIGVSPEKNEAVHGLKGLNETMAFEKARGNAGAEDRLPCVLSVSVTHKGLHGIARKYLEEEFAKTEPLPHLDVYIFTEVETQRLIEEILYPAVSQYLGVSDIGLLKEVIGVDGEYGRHYSFLKAVAALWKICMNRNLKATFKTDLDQVFPQKELLAESGGSAFDHLKSPLWGAEGVDSDNETVHLGMVAGSLVNREDVQSSIYTLDVKYPPEVQGGEGLFFNSALTMVLSAEAERLIRYRPNAIDGKTSCIQRVHVIGGINGIRIDSLFRYRPFTPTFIGRAEDQAYLLSVLFRQAKVDLRYAHVDGLIMRNDLKALAIETTQANEISRKIGDLIRILLFSYYSKALPWPVKTAKAALDPFTGCFISRMPVTLVHLRLAMAVAELNASGAANGPEKAMAVQAQGVRRLGHVLNLLAGKTNPLLERYEKEKKAWDLFYDALNAINDNVESQDFFALKLMRRAENFIRECRLNIGKKA